MIGNKILEVTLKTAHYEVKVDMVNRVVYQPFGKFTTRDTAYQLPDSRYVFNDLFQDQKEELDEIGTAIFMIMPDKRPAAEEDGDGVQLQDIPEAGV